MSLFKNRKRDRLGNSRVSKLRARRRLLSIEGLENRRLLTANPPLVVTVGDGTGAGTLYEMIQLANSQPGADKIVFASGVTTVRPAASLPWITDALSIDGENRVMLDGSGSPGDGLMISGSNVSVFHLAVGNYANGNGITFLGASNGRVQGSRIGTDQAGLVAMPNRLGLFMHNSTSIVIGTDGDGVNDANEGNLISGNTGTGVLVTGASTGTRISGNRIGVNSTGGGALGNGGDGIKIEGASGTLVGTDGNGVSDLLERNTISGNVLRGIYIGGNGGQDTVIAGNFIGTDSTGVLDLGNLKQGVFVSYAQQVRIGTDGSDDSNNFQETNVISGNDLSGIEIEFGVNVKISGNVVGLQANGVSARPNGGHGVVIGAGRFVQVGTNGDNVKDTLERNIVSSNAQIGVNIYGSSFDVNVSGNYIGTDISGTIGRGNGAEGVHISGTSSKIRIGSQPDGIDEVNEGNLISGNSRHGVMTLIEGAVISGNHIGTDVTGLLDLGNSQYGIFCLGAKDTLVRNNLVSGNDWVGIDVAFSSKTKMHGNRVGVDANGVSWIRNGMAGVEIRETSQSTVVGTDGDGVNDANEGNLISGNTGTGVLVIGASTGTRISGNQIGVNASGGGALGNGGDGIKIEGASGTLVGTDGNGVSDLLERNTISGNALRGIYVSGGNSSGSVISGNYLGTGIDGIADVGNVSHGVEIYQSPQAIVSNNLISGNQSGVLVNRSEGAKVYGNTIGLAADGKTILDNWDGGVWLYYDTNSLVGTNGDGVQDVSERNVISGNGFGNIRSTGSNGSKISGNYIGVSIEGSYLLGQRPGASGIDIRYSTNVTIGTDGSDDTYNLNERNIIAGNLYGKGIWVTHATKNRISGNWIGLGPNGESTDFYKNGVGVFLDTGASENLVGSNSDLVEDSAERNVISNNHTEGMTLFGAHSNVIAGNFIGTNPSGLDRLPNRNVGVYLSQTAGNKFESNVISGNNYHGLWIASSRDTIVRGNKMGTGVDGTTQVYNAGHSIVVQESAGSIIGGVSPEDRNVIGFSGGNGVTILNGGLGGNTISGNFIGLSSSGVADIGNSGYGIFVSNSPAVTIGGSVQGAGNVVSGNDKGGIVLVGGATNNAVIQGNKIGTNASGGFAVPNNQFGIYIGSGHALSNPSLSGAHGNLVGGDTDLQRNLVSGNSGSGIWISGANDGQNQIRGNSIGTDLSGAFLGPSQTFGVRLTSGSKNNQITSNQIKGSSVAGIGVEQSEINVLNENLLVSNQNGISMDLFSANSNSLDRNRFDSNVLLAVDLGPMGATKNDNGDIDGIRNAPVLTNIELRQGYVIMKGFARPGTTLDFYTSKSYLNGRGQGRDFLFRASEGGMYDQDNTTGSYDALTTGGVDLGGDTTSRFQFSIPVGDLAKDVALEDLITAISVAPSSEFGNIAKVSRGLSFEGTPGDDTFIVKHLFADQVQVELNGEIVYQGSVPNGESVILDGGLGRDSLAVYGTEVNDSFTVNYTELKLNEKLIVDKSIETRSIWGMSGQDEFIINQPIQEIHGGDGSDRFIFSTHSALVGVLSGGGNKDTLDYSLWEQSVVYRIGTNSAPGIESHSEIESVIGSAELDHLIGADRSNTWSIYDSNQGDVNTELEFIDFENIIGGKEDDLFEFSENGSISAALSGGEGLNTLSYRSFSQDQPVTVNAIQGVATRIGFLVADIQIILGGDGADELHAFLGMPSVIIGNKGNDLIYGSSGRDILIGGLGKDTLRGGSAEDVLIGGFTVHDTGVHALKLIRAEWLSNRSFSERLNNLRGNNVKGIPLNQGFYLNNNSKPTVFNDHEIDSVWGDSEVDWYIAS